MNLKSFSCLSLVALASASLVGACSSGSDSHPAPISSGGSSDSNGGASSSAGTRNSGGTTGRAGSAGSSSAGDANSAGAAGESVTGEGGAGGEDLPPGTVVVVTPGACSETPMWIGPAPLNGVSTAAEEGLLSITADELDIAFLRGGALYVAHRDAANTDFDMGSSVAVPAGYDPSAGAALGGDGKTLVLVSSDHHGFGALTRGDRISAFSSSADTTAFLALNDRATQTMEQYAAPVLAPNGSSFIFTGYTTYVGGTATVYESLSSSGVWGMPNNISKDIFDGTSTARPLPTALSADSRTLFYFDEATSTQMARFRDRAESNAPFYDHIELPGLIGAAPNAKCDRVYYSSAKDVFTEAD
ncbi:MAG TPA: hypothetical protein VGM44_10365 [Polyangiaceae bacterium]|jgi:hypothetical protein